MAKKLTKAEEAKLVAQRSAKTDAADDVRGKVKEEGDKAKANSAKQDKRVSSRDKAGKPTDAAKVDAATPRTKKGAPSAVDASAADASLMDAQPGSAPTPTPRGTTEKNIAANRRGAERTSGRKMTGEESASQGVLEKDLAELQRQERRDARQKDVDITGGDLAEESRQRRLAREETPAATVANPMGSGNAAATEFLPADAPGGANKPYVADEATTATARKLGVRGFPVQGSLNTDAFISSGQPQASSAESADDTHVANLIRNIKQEGSARTVNKGTLARLKSQLATTPNLPFGTPSVCPHSGCTSVVPDITDVKHPDYDAAYGSVACDSCKSKGLKSGNDLPHLQGLRKRGNPIDTDFFNASNY